ncbi:hypothetical protein E2562_024462 [Oryza meyeriana var. granulata]|uniref:Uncharacterized protein n=1 Tax=Oryza meyeriana var. granulata TaxID=110450 RepID=A0A6G1EYQ2_9ORYZ|nr:hypothetical protein E2562_024462 [Oryza meyeriana var. granulata]
MAPMRSSAARSGRGRDCGGPQSRCSGEEATANKPRDPLARAKGGGDRSRPAACVVLPQSPPCAALVGHRQAARSQRCSPYPQTAACLCRSGRLPLSPLALGSRGCRLAQRPLLLRPACLDLHHAGGWLYESPLSRGLAAWILLLRPGHRDSAPPASLGRGGGTRLSGSRSHAAPPPSTPQGDAATASTGGHRP